MLILVVEYAPNCPVHDGWFYSGLRWVQDEDALLAWVQQHTREAFYVKEVWCSEVQEKLEYKIQYVQATHAFVGVEILKAGIKIAHISQHPYEDAKPWVIERY
jgi:hypothetical protein